MCDGNCWSFMPGAMRIDQAEVEIGSEKRQAIVPTVPDNDLSFRLGHMENGGIIHPGIDYRVLFQMRFIFLAFFDRAVVPIQVCEGGKALQPLRL